MVQVMARLNSEWATQWQ